MDDQSEALTGPPTFAHRVLAFLTRMKLRMGSLRLRLGAISQEEIETRLSAIEQDNDTAAALAQDVQASGGSASPA